MASFKKITKEEWLKLSQEEKDYLTFEFNKSVEKRKRIILYTTRISAIFCILALFYIGYAQVLASQTYGKIHDQYGKDAYCYLCGMESLRKCDCIYWQVGYTPDNLTDYKKRVGEYNVQQCKGIGVAEGNEGATNWNPYAINLSIKD